MSAEMINSGTIYQWTQKDGKEIVELWTGQVLTFKKLSDAKLFLSGLEKGVAWGRAKAERERIVKLSV